MKSTIIRLTAPLLTGTCVFLAASCERPAATTATAEPSRAAKPRETRSATRHSAHDRTSAYQWRVGDTAGYRFAMSIAFGESGKPAEALSVRGHYHFAVLAKENDTVTLAATVSDSDVRLGGQTSPIFEELVDDTPALLVLTGNGALQQISFPANVPTEDRHFLMSIHCREFQLRSGSGKWTARETDSCNGTVYQSAYTATGKGSAIKTRSILSTAEGPGQEIRSSEFEAKAGNCWLDSLKGHETIAISHEGNAIGETHYSIMMERDQNAATPDALDRMLATAHAPGEFTINPTEAATGRVPAVERIRIAALREKFAGVPFEMPYEALAKASTLEKHADALTALQDMCDLLTIRPEFAQRVADLLKSGVNPKLSALLAHALELANTEATQKTLASILANPGEYSNTALVQAIVAAGGLGTLKDPAIAEALDSLQSSFGSTENDYSVSDAALFSLSRLAPGNPTLREPLVAVLTPMLAGTDDDSRRTAVLALANAQIFDAELLDLAQNLLTAEAPQTRDAALAYFESAPDLTSARIDAIAGLLHDSIAPIQIQAIATLAAAHRRDGNPNALAALQSLIRDHSASEEVRQAARTALGNASN